jgi:hypothetical protein
MFMTDKKKFDLTIKEWTLPKNKPPEELLNFSGGFISAV